MGHTVFQESVQDHTDIQVLGRGLDYEAARQLARRNGGASIMFDDHFDRKVASYR